MITNDKAKMGGTMFKPETAHEAISAASLKHANALPARGFL